MEYMKYCTAVLLYNSISESETCDKQGRRRTERQRMSKNSIASDKADRIEAKKV